ncbi:MAG: ABC transporter ATP-binding protein [Bacteroidota bacterium]
MKEKPAQKSGISRLLEIAGVRKRMLLLSATLAVLHAALSLVPYIITFYIIEQLITQGGSVLATHYLWWAFTAVVGSVVLLYASGMASHMAAFNILYELRTQIANKLGKLPIGYISRGSSGAFKKIISDDVERIELFIAHGIPDIVKAIVLPLLTLCFLFAVDWRLALVSLLPLLFVVIASYFSFGTDKSKTLMKKYHDSLEDMNSGIVEFVRVMPVMKIFNQSASNFKKFSTTVSQFEFFVTQWIKQTSTAWGMLLSFLNNALLPLLVVGLILFTRFELELSVFFLFLILGVGYIRFMFAMISFGPQISMINHGVNRIDEILFNIEEHTAGNEAFPKQYEVVLDQVDFRYTETVEVLKSVSFIIPQGSITALVGPSGSGKSTIGQLLARFYDVNHGSIRIGGINVKDIEETALMREVGFVFQDNMMFYQTIADNICMGAAASQEEIEAAAKIANCHDFILKLPQGYQTRFGDKGVHLSGGEQQRIQLARVVLKNPKVLILDEATAFSDPENEYLIMQAFARIIADKTVMVIAHRLSTITTADQIVVMENGRVNAVGKHEALLKSSELYSKMWNAHNRAKEFELAAP